MKIPKPIMPVHTCELGAHQSISHTSQQNRVPREPINLLCDPLNGCIYGASGIQKGSQKGSVEHGAGKPGSPARRPRRRKEKLAYAIALAKGRLGLQDTLTRSPSGRRSPPCSRALQPECPPRSLPSPPAAPLLTQSRSQAEAPAPRPAEAGDSRGSRSGSGGDAL